MTGISIFWLPLRVVMVALVEFVVECSGKGFGSQLLRIRRTVEKQPGQTVG